MLVLFCEQDGFYLAMCAWSLARAHARTGSATLTVGYLGKNDVFALADGNFALTYADQTEHGHEALVAAVKLGRIGAEQGI